MEHRRCSVFAQDSSRCAEKTNYHCVIHQQALAAKAVDVSHVMNVVVKTVNSIHDLDSAYGDLILHADVRWLGRGKVLRKCSEVEERGIRAAVMMFAYWTYFLTDLTAKLNDLNREFQGKTETLLT